MPNHERFLGHLKGLKQLPDSGKYLARWSARCPAHNDRTPSLSISLTRDRLLVHCHAKCRTEDVVRAVGLEMSDLYLSSSEPAPSRTSGSGKPSPDNTSPLKTSLAPKSSNPKSSSAKSSNQTSKTKKKSDRSGRIEETYDYYDAEGTLLYQVVRFDPKGFRQRRPDPHGNWIWSMQGVERVPYYLPEMLKAIGEGHPILIVEGEKDVETALQMRSDLEASSGRSFSATTAPGGAGNWRSSFSCFFEGAHVWIVPDIDEAGFEHARQVATRLRGVAESIKVLRLPSTEEHFDLSAWTESGGSAEDLLRIADQSPYLLSRAHPTHEVDFESVPGPSASLKEIKEYLVSGGSVQSGQDSGNTSTGKTSPEEASTGDASSKETSLIPPPKQQDGQPTSTGKPPKWEGFGTDTPEWEAIGAPSSEWEGIGVEVSEGHRPTEAILAGLDRIENKSRNGEVGFSLLPAESEISDSEIYTSEGSISDSGLDEQTAHPEGNEPSREVPPSDVAVSSEEADAQGEAAPLLPSDLNSSKPGPSEPESIAETAETPSSRKNGSVEVPSKQNGTSRPSETRFSSESGFSTETRRVIRLLEEEGAEVLSAGGAFYLLFPFIPSVENGSHKQAGEAHRHAVSGKAYPLESPLVTPLLLRLAYDRKSWIPSPDACRAALLFLTPAVPSPAHVSSRVAAGNGVLYIDAGENTILEVRPGKWQARSSAPALFLRSEYACPLPAPKKRGSLTPFRRLLQIGASEAWVGIRGWLLGALCPTGPVPPLLLEGEDSRRLSRLAEQLASLLDPRSTAPLDQFQPLLSTCPEATADPRIGGLRQTIPFQQPPFYEEPRQNASPACPFVCCLPARFLKRSPALPPSCENGDEHPQPLATRLIFVGSERGLRPELRKGLLAVRPTFLDELRTTYASKPASASTGGEGPSERDARGEALGVLLQGAAEAMDSAEEMTLPKDLRNGPYRAFLAWVAAAEAGLSPASLGSERSGPSSRPFVDVWREGRRRLGLLRRLVRALRRWMQAKT